jgi:protoporphyrin/coproporphyrin ferrochelatase
MVPPTGGRRRCLASPRKKRQYRNCRYLDKDGPTRQAIDIMTAAIPIEKVAVDPRPERVGVLLVNLGTPDTADTRGVRVYLKEFLSDPRVIEDQGLVWKLVLNCIILRTRPARKARDYRKIWNTANNESPLKTITRAQSDKLAAAISDHDHVVVDWAMRYGNPSIASGIDVLTAQGCDRLLVVPLYPQYSAATSATVCDEVFRVLGQMRAQPTLRVTPPYYDDPDYIEALAVSIGAHLAGLPFQPEIILASFHGMPQKYVDKGDPYQTQCIATTNALRQRMGLDASKLMLTFQSRFGFDAWLQPYTDKTVEKLAKEGVRRIAVVTPGFSADCLETLEEIAQENAEIFKHHGGEQFTFIPCLNDSDPGMDVIRQLVLRELQGWI